MSGTTKGWQAGGVITPKWDLTMEGQPDRRVFTYGKPYGIVRVDLRDGYELIDDEGDPHYIGFPADRLDFCQHFVQVVSLNPYRTT